MVLYHAEAMALQSLTHLLAYTPGPLRFILVDNGGTCGRIQSWLDRGQCRFIANDRNVGYYAAINQALAEAQSEHVILSAPDHFVLPNWWLGLASAVEHHGLGWVSPEWTTGPYDASRAWDALASMPEAIGLGQVSTSCALINWKLLKHEIGFFDEQFFLTHGDSDYLERMRDKGIPFGLIAGSQTHHQEHGCRKAHTVEEDTRLELEDEARFRRKWASRPDVLERHRPMPSAEKLTEHKRELWA